jgi:hypothetical protein
VQQLCDAGEEEFLEIMALVGMASKPLHVRRLQKALQEWVSNPGTSRGTRSLLNSDDARLCCCNHCTVGCRLSGLRINRGPSGLNDNQKVI